MDWKEVGLQFVKKGLPLLGGLIAGPAGSLGAQAAISLVSSVLGKGEDEITPETVAQTINANPESLVELRKLEMQHKERLQEFLIEEKRIQLERDRLDFQDQAGGREVIKAALISDDPLVRQARPKMMLLIGKTCIVFAFYAPLSVIAAGQLGIFANIVTEYMSMLRWIGGFLFSAFMTSFTGYTVARYGDKRTAAQFDSSKALDVVSKVGKFVC